MIPKIDDALKADVIKWSAFYEHRIRLGVVRCCHTEELLTDLANLWIAESDFPSRGVCGKVYAWCGKVCGSLSSGDDHILTGVAQLLDGH